MLQPELYLMTSYEAIPKLLIYVTEGKEKKKKRRRNGSFLDGTGVWGRKDTGICMAESLCCPPETITTLLISYLYPNIK